MTQFPDKKIAEIVYSLYTNKLTLTTKYKTPAFSGYTNLGGKQTKP